MNNLVVHMLLYIYRLKRLSGMILSIAVAG